MQSKSRQSTIGKLSARKVLIVVLVLLLIALGAYYIADNGSKVASNSSSFPSLEKAVSRLITALNSTPSADFSDHSLKPSLVSQASQGESAAKKSNACDVVKALTPLFNQLNSYPNNQHSPMNNAAASSLSALGLDALVIALIAPGSSSCGGAPLSVPSLPSSGPQSHLVNASNVSATADTYFPLPTFVSKSGAGKYFLEMIEPGMGGNGEIGEPEVPFFGENFAIPTGARPTLAVNSATSFHIHGINLWPIQPPEPASFLPSNQASFAQSSDAYSKNSNFPEAEASIGTQYTQRGLNINTVSLYGATYNPAAKELQVTTSITFKENFGIGSTATFGQTYLGSPWNQAFQTLWGSQLLNWSIVPKYLGGLGSLLLPCGEEMMIVTDSALSGAANTLASARSKDGIPTNVFITDGTNGIGISVSDIRGTVQAELQHPNCIHPSYLTILGDVDHVGTWEVDFGTNVDSKGVTHPNFFEQNVASDLPYGLSNFTQLGLLTNPYDNVIDGTQLTDLAPDIFIGRIPATDINNANTLVSNTVSYEDTPPNQLSFYSHVTGAALYQPCSDLGCKDGKGNIETPSSQDHTSFLRTSELAGEMAGGAGKTFNPVVTDDSGNDAGQTINPQTLDNGDSIPSDVTSFSGNTSDISSSVNNGSFLLWHSDHGYTDGSGWYAPGFGYNDINNLNVGSMRPFVWSSDCDSGKFDHPSGVQFVTNGQNPSFGEYWLQDSQAIGFVGASRESPIYQDGFMLDGMASNLFPELGNVFLAFLGGTPVPPVEQAGILLDSARNYMATRTTSNLSADTTDKATELEYNLFGDPSMNILRDQPKNLMLKSAILNGNIVNLANSNLPNGTELTVIQGNVPLGRGVVNNGALSLTIAPASSNAPITVVASKPGYLSSNQQLGSLAPPTSTSLPPPSTTTSLIPITSTTTNTSTPSTTLASPFSIRSVNMSIATCSNPSPGIAVIPSTCIATVTIYLNPGTGGTLNLKFSGTEVDCQGSSYPFSQSSTNINIAAGQTSTVQSKTLSFNNPVMTSTPGAGQSSAIVSAQGPGSSSVLTSNNVNFFGNSC